MKNRKGVTMEIHDTMCMGGHDVHLWNATHNLTTTIWK